MESLTNITSLQNEITRLQRRSELLEFILGYFNVETQTIDFPEEFYRNRISEEILSRQPYLRSPRTLLVHMMQTHLEEEDLQALNIYL